MENNKCQAGCKVFTGVEIKHHKNCIYYPNSMSEKFDEMKAELKKLRVADVLTQQLDKWIEDCQAQADVFFERRMTVSETSSLAMKVAYMNVKTLVENNR